MSQEKRGREWTNKFKYTWSKWSNTPYKAAGSLQSQWLAVSPCTNAAHGTAHKPVSSTWRPPCALPSPALHRVLSKVWRRAVAPANHWQLSGWCWKGKLLVRAANFFNPPHSHWHFNSTTDPKLERFLFGTYTLLRRNPAEGRGDLTYASTWYTVTHRCCLHSGEFRWSTLLKRIF